MPEDQTKPARRFWNHMRSLREEEILRAASRALLQHGCDGFRVEEVAAACGVAKGTCYQHFGSRPALITAAIHRLDESLAKRLLSPPPPRHRPRRQRLEWALLEAVDAELVTLAQRARGNDPPAPASDAMAWPCCLGRVPCPYGGAVRSIDALRHWTTGFTSRHTSRVSLYVGWFLTLAPHFFFFGRGSTRAPCPRAIRAAARELFNQLF